MAPTYPFSAPACAAVALEATVTETCSCTVPKEFCTPATNAITLTKVTVK